MHAQLQTGRIKKLILESPTGEPIRVKLDWFQPSQSRTASADVIVAGLTIGNLYDSGPQVDGDDSPRYTATVYGPVGLPVRRVFCDTQDFVEGVAFAVTGPGGWYADAHRDSYYTSDAETHELDVLNVLGVT